MPEDQLELFDFDYSESKWRYYNERSADVGSGLIADRTVICVRVSPYLAQERR